MHQLIFYAHVYACSPSYTNEELKTIPSIQKQSVFGLLIIDVLVLKKILKKTPMLYISKTRFN